MDAFNQNVVFLKMTSSASLDLITRGILIWLAAEELTRRRCFLSSLKVPSLSLKSRRQEMLPFRLNDL